MSSRRVRVITLTGVLVIALIIGFSLLINYLSRDIREIPLPGAGASSSSPETSGMQENNGLEHVVVTKDNVQDVIATLDRPVSYTRSVRIEIMYEGGMTPPYEIRTSVNDGATAMKISGSGISANKNIVIAGSRIYIWYDGDKTPYVRPAESPEDEKKSSDEYQMMMSYEDILKLDKSSITAASYMEYSGNGEFCVYVQYVTELLHYKVKCYISVESGLLIHVEKYDGDMLIYKMTTSDFSRSEPALSAFELPDGTNPVSDP
ncbi:MAG: hypothetical protein GXY05_10920 [Clostridiales bacterium]|nr:hypothetical protein [Clostridiales bacterium]